MDKLLQFGRKAWFYVRVLSGYEEKRIRSYRLLMEKRMEMAQARKQELKRHPEQVILSEVRQMVQRMQAVKQELEDVETAVDEYLKPIDKDVKIIMDMQMDREEMRSKEVSKFMQEQIKMQREIAATRAEAMRLASNDTQASETVAENSPKQEAVK